MSKAGRRRLKTLQYFHIGRPANKTQHCHASCPLKEMLKQGASYLRGIR